MSDGISIRYQPRNSDPKKLTDRLRRQRSYAHFAHTARAVEALTKEARSVMLRAIQGQRMSYSKGSFQVFRVTGGLHGAVLGAVRYPYNGNPLRGALVIKHPHWNFVKAGSRVHDMKPRLLASSKAKIGKDGKRYVVVPIPVDPTHRFSARVFRIVKEGSRGWIFGGSIHRRDPYRGLQPRRVDLFVQEEMKRRGMETTLRRAISRDLRGES